MQTLNLPQCDFELRTHRGKRVILDPVRQRFVPLTPEEWVRQHLVQYLILDRGVPASLIALEMAFLYHDRYNRADIIVHNRQLEPVMLIECKNPTVTIGQDVFDQIGRYNAVVRAGYLGVSNGLTHFCCRVDHTHRTIDYLDEFPMYEAIA